MFLTLLFLITSIGVALLVVHYNEGFTDKSSVLGVGWALTVIGLALMSGMIYSIEKNGAKTWTNIILMLSMGFFAVGLVLVIAHYDHQLFDKCNVRVAGFTMSFSGAMSGLSVIIWGALAGGDNSITHSVNNNTQKSIQQKNVYT